MAGAKAIKDMTNPGALTKKQMFGMSVAAGLTSGIVGNQANYGIAKTRFANARKHHRAQKAGPMPVQSGGGVLY